MNGLFGAGLILLAVAAFVDLAGWRKGPPYILGAAGSACLALAGGFALAGRTVRLPVAGWLGQPVPGQSSADLSADRLSGLFLVMAFGAAALVSVAFASWASRPDTVTRRGLGAGYALALGSVAVIVTGQDAFTVLFGWEGLTVAFYLLAGSDRHHPRSAQVTVAFGKLSGTALLAGLLLLAAKSHSIALASFPDVPGGAARTTALVLLLAGFAVKAGLVPFQVWLPRGYSAAPGPARAIMAGVCVNVAFYGMFRTLELLGHPPGWLVGMLLLLGAVSALLGIAHATVQNRLNRVIAYSSVENSGLIVVGFGVALTGAAVHDQRLIAAGLLAATLQMVAHTAAKSLLFTSAAGIEGGGGRAGRRPGAAARRRAAGAVERVRPVDRVGDAGRAAADGRVRVRVVPARVADAAVPGARPRLPAGPRGGRGRGRADHRVRRGDVRPAGRAGGARPRSRRRFHGRLARRASTAGPDGSRWRCSRPARWRSRR